MLDFYVRTCRVMVFHGFGGLGLSRCGLGSCVCSVPSLTDEHFLCSSLRPAPRSAIGCRRWERDGFGGFG